jgi:hypothetical protein
MTPSRRGSAYIGLMDTWNPASFPGVVHWLAKMSQPWYASYKPWHTSAITRQTWGRWSLLPKLSRGRLERRTTDDPISSWLGIHWADGPCCQGSIAVAYRGDKTWVIPSPRDLSIHRVDGACFPGPGHVRLPGAKRARPHLYVRFVVSSGWWSFMSIV